MFANATKFVSLGTNFPCFSLIEIFLLATVSENLAASWPQGCFLKARLYTHRFVFNKMFCMHNTFAVRCW